MNKQKAKRSSVLEFQYVIFTSFLVNKDKGGFLIESMVS